MRTRDAVRAAHKLKPSKQQGSYAYTVKDRRRRFHVQTDAWPCEDGEIDFTFAVCDCGERQRERTTTCGHTLRVLMDIVGDADDEHVP